MYVCTCARVRERELRAAIREGAHSVESVGAACGAGIRCGLCHEQIAELIAKAKVRAHGGRDALAA
jgi:bacterioferritin-associated ferredoxin